MSEFFQTNREVVYFIYGQAFFVLGLAIAFRSRKHSELALGAHLWLLAVFGLVHGVYEWGIIFIPIQQRYLPGDAVNALRVLQLALETISFFALYQFGAELVAVGARRAWFWRALPGALLALWAGAFLVVLAGATNTFREIWTTGDAFSRYLLGVPGAAMAAFGLWLQARHVQHFDVPHIANYLRGAAFAFAAYAGASIIVPRNDFFPATILNYDTFFQTAGFPVAMIRALCGILIAYLIFRAMDIFDVETDRQLKDAARARAIAADRERIGRELHDGIIQSLYAAGLNLEDAGLTIDEDAGRAREKIGAVTQSLNRTIRDIRSYILDLRRAGESGDWHGDLDELARAFRLQTLVDAEFRVEGEPHVEPNLQARMQIVAIAREALVNAGRHARATRVAVKLIYQPDQVALDVTDNGVGFAVEDSDTTRADGSRQGLRNMRERAQLIGAQLAIESAPRRGTRVRLILPNVA
jgi:signal transduction histidine kinase